MTSDIARWLAIPLVANIRPVCFHPKTFYFQSENEDEAIFGSAIFSNGKARQELSWRAFTSKGAADEQLFKQVRKQLVAPLPQMAKLADSYRRKAKRECSRPGPSRPYRRSP